jgi:hypothetical protein
VTVRDAGPARHEKPAIDELALAAAREADRLLDAARIRGLPRWEGFLEPLPDLLRDSTLSELRGVARRARAAYGPKDSIRDDLPAELTEPFLSGLDRLLAALARDEASR